MKILGIILLILGVLIVPPLVFGYSMYIGFYEQPSMFTMWLHGFGALIGVLVIGVLLSMFVMGFVWPIGTGFSLFQSNDEISEKK